MSTHNPWQTLSTRVVYKNPWITVREDQVIRPDGQPGIYGVVETRIATGVLALTEADEIYLVGQYRYTMEEYSWEIIEGGSDPGEDALEAAKRELREEAGLVASEWAPLGGEIHLTNCHSSERGYLYVARGLTHVGQEPEGTELLQLKKVPFTEALAMVDRGEIKDAITIMGILRYARLRQG
ncbi:MAG: NUDIX hydrolase [Candidatus Hydrogenedentes bacterium]|nr:NUDIX hydrolase [Candidatus Hydrogenedentota bacterium]